MSAQDPGMETPVAPIEKAPTRKGLRRARKASRRERGSRKPAARGGGGPLSDGLAYAGAASTRVLSFVVLVQLLLGLTVVLPFWIGISERLDHHAHAEALAGEATVYDRSLGWESGLHSGIWNDIKRESKELFDGLTLTHFWVAVVAWLFGAMASGGFLGTAVAGEDPVRVGAFLTHGAKWFGPMLRMGIVVALAYYVIGRLVFEAWGGTVKPSEDMASSETSGWWGERIREYLATVLILWCCIAADLGRAEIVVFGRKSALGAFFGALAARSRPCAYGPWRSCSASAPTSSCSGWASPRRRSPAATCGSC